VQIGIDSFAAAYDDTSLAVSAPDRLSNLVEQIEHADQVGLDSFGVGEHHRKEDLDSAPTVILGAAAARTRRIRLTSAVTVLSSADPVRVFQNFATLDLLSQGRAEIVAGRGSFTESFPLFGLQLEDYDSLFAENLDLLLKIRENEHVHSSGKHRAPLTGQGVYPRPVHGNAEEVTEKIAHHSDALGGISRISFQMNAASLPHAKLMQAIELVGARVAPALREALAGDEAA
jgi:alkanesulfonate monooxygenase SsuD/methylene tetrahydromethanopterin reductase-like flavin-dependent oxidoreductase (luciferase family)